ncbi:MAG: hypothetical protein HYR86_01645 [Candidatus Rokubacteria bacterium]|nr:hypothetical protein [Candidatus Rokubacteria bacterium]
MKAALALAASLVLVAASSARADEPRPAPATVLDRSPDADRPPVTGSAPETAPPPAGTPGTPVAPGTPSVERLAEARARVDHHVREATALAGHFDTMLREGCPRFASPGEWKTYLDGEVDRMVLMAAHVEQAWAEAKEVKDKDVRLAAKAPRRRLDDARALMDKLQACAEDNGTTVNQGAVWRRIEREVPRRQAEITLPH